MNKGRKDGVEPDMGVVSERGVVGIVSTVSDHFSVVIPLLNPKFKLSCKVLGSSYFGTLAGTGVMRVLPIWTSCRATWSLRKEIRS